MTSAPHVIDFITTNEGKKYAPAGRMAIAIVEIHQAQGGCLPQDLNGRGFTVTEVDELWHMANAMADVELKLMNNKKLPSFRREKRYA